MIRILWGRFTLLALLLVVSLLVSCRDDGGTQKKEEKVLYIYSWANYLPQEILEDFTKETGVEVVYDVFENNEALEAKLLMGGGDFDIVFPSISPFLVRQIKAGLYAPIDKSKLSNYKFLDESVLKITRSIDQDHVYSIPYAWGTSGLAYNENLASFYVGDNFPKTWALLFNPDYSNKFADCGIAVPDVPADVLTPALVYLGLNPNSRKKSDLRRAFKAFQKVRSNVRAFQVDRAPEDLMVGNLCLAQTWSGDVLQVQARYKELCLLQGKAPDHCHNQPVKYFVPEEGAEIWCDSMCIPKHAPHPNNAYLFINYILRPEVAAKITNKLLFATANKKARSLVRPEIRDNPIIYPPKKIMDKLFIEDILPTDIERWRTRKWTKAKKELNNGET